MVVEDGQRALEAGGDERVARDELAALDALQQEAARPGAELEQRRDRRFEVGQHLAIDRRVVRRGGHAAQLGEAGKIACASSCDSLPRSAWTRHVLSRAREVVQAHRVAGQVERLARFGAGAAAAVGQDVFEQAGLALVLGAPLADRIEERVERDDQLLLDLDVADRALDVARLEIVDLVEVRR